MKVRIFSIRLKLFIAFAFTGFLASVLVGFQNYENAKKVLLKNRENVLLALREIKKEQIKTSISLLTSQFHYYTLSDRLSEAMKEFSKAYYSVETQYNKKYLQSCLKEMDTYYKTTIYESSTENIINIPEDYVNTSTPGLLLQCYYIGNRSNSGYLEVPVNVSLYNKVYEKYGDMFRHYQEKHSLEDVMLINENGDIVYSYKQKLDFGTNVLDGPWKDTELSKIFDATSSKNRYKYYYLVRLFDFSFYPPSNMKPVAFVAAPIYNENNFMGILLGEISSEEFAKLVISNDSFEVEGLGKTGDSYIVGGDGYMRTNSRYLMTAKGKDEYLTHLREISYPPQLIDQIDHSDSSILLQKIPDKLEDLIQIKKDGITVTDDYTGVSSITAYTLLDIPELDWGLVLSISDKEAQLPVVTLWKDILRSTMVIILVVVVFTIFISSAITRPILQLVKAVIGFTEGDYSLHINDQSNDEIGRLARTFDQMAQTINSRSEEIINANELLTNKIMDKERAEEALEKEKKFISFILDSQVFLLMITNRSNRILKINHMFKQVTHFDESEVMYLDEGLFSGTEYALEADKAFEKGDTHNFVADFYTKPGKKKIISWYITSIKYAFESDSPEELLIWTGVDITEQREVEEKLKDNAKLMQSLTTNAKDGIFITNEEGGIISWNESAEKLFGYNEENILGRNSSILFTDNIDELIDKTDSSREGTRGVTVETEGVQIGGIRFSVELSISRMNIQGKINSMYIVRDSSLRKQKEEELKHAFEKARIAERAKTDFLANMSHEIRTPLNGILGFIDLLKETKLDQSQFDYVKIISSSADSLLGVINEILDFSKIESGKMTVENIEFSLFEEFEKSADIFVAKANEKHVDFIVDLDVKMPKKVIGDPLKIKQIISNLISNAIKFTDANGFVSLKAKAIYKDADKCIIRVQIKDNGIGISEEKQAKIFSAFSQGDNSVTRKYGGTGLGLAISSKLATLIGSKLELSSIPNEGSNFWFDVPLKVVEDNQEKLMFDGLKVAVAKDNMPQEKVLVNYLNSLGCEVTMFEKFEELGNVSVIFIDYSKVTHDQIRNLSSLVPGSARVVIAKDTDRNDISRVDSLITRTVFKPIYYSKVVAILKEILYGTKATMSSEKNKPTFNGNVMVAEDNPVNQRLIKILLSEMGLNVVIAENGKIAYEKIVSNKYDIIFMDIHMPEMDGITVTKKYMQWCQTQGKNPVPVVALTANVIQEDQKRYIESGMSDFLPKPIIVSQLEKVLKKYLSVKKTEETTIKKSPIELLSKELGIDDENFVLELVKEFAEITAVQIKELQETIVENDGEKAIKIISNIYGSASNLNFSKITKILKRGDAYINGGDFIMAHQVLDELNYELKSIKENYGLRE